MTKLFKDYLWKEGIPYGVTPLEDSCSEGYKIIMDPYRKRISIEKYANGKLISVVYDSALFNFRHLKPSEQIAWQKEIIKESDNEVVALIRNQDDRVVIKETYIFKDGFCRECHTHSPHGIFVSRQQMFYTVLGDSFNGVMLFDANDHLVMQKKYKADESGEFTEVLTEQWKS